MSKQINLRMNEYSLTKLEKLAEKEQRPIAAMAKILIDEAIKTRESELLQSRCADLEQGELTSHR